MEGRYIGGPPIESRAAIQVGSNNIVNNDGAVTGGINGVEGSGSIIVNNTAGITANGGVGVKSLGDAAVNSTGSISGHFGVQAVGTATVVNSGTISGPAGGTFQGVAGKAVSLVNSGTIATAFVGVNAGTGGASVINLGDIRVTEKLSAAISSNGGLTLDNSGTISGSVSTLSGASNVANKGTIDGVGNIAIYGAGALELNNLAGGVVSSSGKKVATVGAANITLTNEGIIRSSEAGSEAVTAYENLVGTNIGTISAGNDGSGVHAFRDLSYQRRVVLTHSTCAKVLILLA